MRKLTCILPSPTYSLNNNEPRNASLYPTPNYTYAYLLFAHAASVGTEPSAITILSTFSSPVIARLVPVNPVVGVYNTHRCTYMQGEGGEEGEGGERKLTVILENVCVKCFKLCERMNAPTHTCTL